MAVNQVHPAGARYLPVASGVKSGDPVLVGAGLVGVAETDRDTNGNAVVNIKPGDVYAIPVKGIDAGGNSAVAVGDILYITTADAVPVSKKATGVKFGYALGVVTTGATATIQVRLV